MNCSKCGERLKVIETRTQDGMKVKTICYRCRFESFVVVPNKTLLRATSQGDVRDRATGFVSLWTVHFQACNGLELDKMANVFRAEVSAAKDYPTHRNGFLQSDQEYRHLLLSTIDSIARAGIGKHEQISGKLAQERQKKEREHPQAQASQDQWWLGCEQTKPAMVEIGQRWSCFDQHGIVTYLNKTKTVAVIEDTSCFCAEMISCNQNYRFFGYEPKRVKPLGIKLEQFWTLDENSHLDGLYRVDKINPGTHTAKLVRLGDGFPLLQTYEHILESSHWRHVPLDKPKPEQVLAGQKWTYVTGDMLDRIVTVDKVSQNFVAFTVGTCGHAGIMLSDPAWRFVE